MLRIDLVFCGLLLIGLIGCGSKGNSQSVDLVHEPTADDDLLTGNLSRSSTNPMSDQVTGDEIPVPEALFNLMASQSNVHVIDPAAYTFNNDFLDSLELTEAQELDLKRILHDELVDLKRAESSTARIEKNRDGDEWLVVPALPDASSSFRLRLLESVQEALPTPKDKLVSRLLRSALNQLDYADEPKAICVQYEEDSSGIMTKYFSFRGKGAYLTPVTSEVRYQAHRARYGHLIEFD